MDLPIVRRWTVRDGIPDAKIETIYADQAGAIWIGMHDGGIARFCNGTIGDVFNRQSGLGSNAIFSILEDRDGLLWVGTGNGLSIYDGKRFTVVDGTQGLAFLWGSYQDESGVLWFGLDRRPGEPPAVCRWDGSLSIVNLSKDKDLVGQSIHCVGGDGAGHVWFGGWYGVYVYDGEFRAVELPGEVQDAQGLHWSSGNLWISSMSGMWRMRGDSVTRIDIEKSVQEGAHYNIASDGNGRLWSPTLDGRLICYEEGRGRRVHQFPFNAGNAACLFHDDSLFVGTYGGGLYQLAPHSNGRRYSGSKPPISSSMRSIAWTTDGIFMATKSRGLCMAVGNEVEFVDASPLADVEHMCMIADCSGNLWVSVRGGRLLVYSVGHVRMLAGAKPLEGASIRAIEQDGSGRIWFASGLGYGIGWYEQGKTGVFTVGQAPSSVQAMATAPDGTLWVGSNNLSDWPGLARFDGEQFVHEPGPRDVPIRALCFDENGWLWIGTPEGLYVRTGRGIEPRLTLHDALPCLIITSIVADGGRLYIGTEGGGMLLYDIELNFHVVSSHDDPDADIINQVHKDPEGCIRLATEAGLYVLAPVCRTVDLVVSYMLAGAPMGLAGEKIHLSEYVDLVFEVTAPAAAYRYRLRGHEVHWQRTETPRIAYNDLPRGEYVFEVQAFDDQLNRSALYSCQVSIAALVQQPGIRPLIGDPKRTAHLMGHLADIARSDVGVLIFGETGTGKSDLANIIHGLSVRTSNPFYIVNCGAFPSGLIDSELFGHEKGSFTGALQQKLGYFELSDGGTLFLDEVGDLPLELQARLLIVLQDKWITRVGGRKRLPVDVRIIAATNKDLSTEIAEGRFREDLYMRLKVFELKISPLRERPDDIPYLVDHFLRHYAHEHKVVKPSLSDDVWEHLIGYSWKGNVRDLQHYLQRAIIKGHGADHIGMEHFDFVDEGVSDDELIPPTLPLDQEIEQLRRRRFVEALEETHGNLKQAASLLGMKPPNLHRWLNEYKIDKTAFK